MPVYYNEHDPKAAAWLRELITAGELPEGEVDVRSIVDVTAADLAGFTACHFFAGIGGWAYALRLAGWPADRPVWTGSCPCQPFSAAGARRGTADERHLWPAFFRLIGECRPDTIFGEQVASKDGLTWLDLVHADLEGADYTVGACDLCAAGVGAPHIRQRLYFVGQLAESIPLGRGGRCDGDSERDSGQIQVEGSGAVGVVAKSDCQQEHPATAGRLYTESSECGATRGVAESDGRLTGDGDVQRSGEHGRIEKDGGTGKLADTDSVSFWSACDWLPCTDGKARPVEPGTFPLAHGLPARVGRLRGYGNAIVPQVAAAFIEAVMEEGA